MIGKLTLVASLTIALLACAQTDQRSDRAVGANPGDAQVDDAGIRAIDIAGEPVGLYRDEDKVARALVGGDDTARAIRFRQILASDPNNFSAHVELGYLESMQGDREASAGHYAKAKRAAGDHSVMQRRLFWSEGWSYFNLGNYDGAVSAWSKSARLHGGAPFWLPYSYSVALWQAGERAGAVRWYGAAVASNPDAWSTEAGMLKQTAHWKPREVTAIKEVYAAHAAAKG